MDVATFFGFCVWLVPFFLFLSLSANDNVLPSSGDGAMLGSSTPSINAPAGHMVHVGPRTSILKAVLDPLLDLIPSRARGYRGSRSQRDGLIASPQRSAPPSPLMMPSHGDTAPWSAGNGAQFAAYSPPVHSNVPPLSPSALGGYGPATPTLSRYAQRSPSPVMMGRPPPPMRANTSPSLQQSAGAPPPAARSRVPSQFNDEDVALDGATAGGGNPAMLGPNGYDSPTLSRRADFGKKAL